MVAQRAYEIRQIDRPGRFRRKKAGTAKAHKDKEEEKEKINLSLRAQQSYSLVIARNKVMGQSHPVVIASAAWQSHKKKILLKRNVKKELVMTV